MAQAAAATGALAKALITFGQVRTAARRTCGRLQRHRAHWIEAGRCYQRLALQAAALDLRTAFINQPVEVPALRSQFATFLGIGDRRPDLVMRIGRGPEMPRSLRRPVEQVLV